MSLIKNRLFYLISLFLCIYISAVLAEDTNIVKKNFRIGIVKTSEIIQYEEPVPGFKKFVQNRIKADFYEVALPKNVSESEKRIRNFIQCDLYLAIGDRAAIALKKIIKNKPIIVIMVLNWDNLKITSDNITGITLEIPQKPLFSTYQNFFPKMKNIGVIYHKQRTQNIIDRASKAAAELGFELVTAQINSPLEMERAFDKISKKIDCFWMIADPVVYGYNSPFERIIKSCRTLKIPFFTFSEKFVEAGGLVAVSPVYSDMGIQAGDYAIKILTGAKKVSELPVIPASAIIALNDTVAKELNLSYSKMIYSLVHRIIESQ